MREQAGVEKGKVKSAPVVIAWSGQVADSQTRRIDRNVFLKEMLHSLRAPY